MSIFDRLMARDAHTSLFAYYLDAYCDMKYTKEINICYLVKLVCIRTILINVILFAMTISVGTILTHATIGAILMIFHGISYYELRSISPELYVAFTAIYMIIPIALIIGYGIFKFRNTMKLQKKKQPTNNKSIIRDIIESKRKKYCFDVKLDSYRK